MKKVLSAVLLSSLLTGSSMVWAGYDPAMKSIDTPPGVSRQQFDAVKSNHQGQYQYAAGLSSKFVEVDGVRIHYVEGGPRWDAGHLSPRLWIHLEDVGAGDAGFCQKTHGDCC